MIKIREILIIFILFLISFQLSAKSTFSGNRLREACIDYIYSLYNDDIEVSIKNNIKDEVFQDDNISARCSGNKENLRGNCFVAIEFFRQDRLVKRVEVPARIKIFRDVVVSKQLIRSGDFIDETMLVIQRKDITNIQEEQLVNHSEITGKKALRNITEGAVITGGLLENDIVIRRGDIVRIFAQSGAVRISSSAKALQDAKIGQKIRIQREGTRNILDGYVAKDGSVFISK